MANYQIICNAETKNGKFCKQQLDDFLICKFHQRRIFEFIEIKYTCNQICKDSHSCKSKVSSENTICNFHLNSREKYFQDSSHNSKNIISKNRTTFISILLNNFFFISFGFLFYHLCLWYITNHIIIKEQFSHDYTIAKDIVFPFCQKHLNFISSQFINYKFFYQTLIQNYFFIFEKSYHQLYRFISCDLFSVYITTLDFCFIPVQKDFFSSIRQLIYN